MVEQRPGGAAQHQVLQALVAGGSEHQHIGLAVLRQLAHRALEGSEQEMASRVRHAVVGGEAVEGGPRALAQRGVLVRAQVRHQRRQGLGRGQRVEDRGQMQIGIALDRQRQRLFDNVPVQAFVVIEIDRGDDALRQGMRAHVHQQQRNRAVAQQMPVEPRQQQASRRGFRVRVLDQQVGLELDDVRQGFSQRIGIADRLGRELRVRRIQKLRLLLEPEPPFLKQRLAVRSRARLVEYAHVQGGAACVGEPDRAFERRRALRLAHGDQHDSPELTHRVLHHDCKQQRTPLKTPPLREDRH